MNIFRFCGDMLHLSSILLLLWKIHKSKSCVGVSARMQEVYFIVFCLRYMDLLWQFISLYNSCMKLFYLISTGYLVYLMRFKPPVNQTYDRETDGFKYELYLLPPAFVVGFLTAPEWDISEIFWSTSIWLEAVALLPQVTLLQKMREVENLTSHFVAALGLYRAFYILNWVYRYFIGDLHWRDWPSVGGGVIQTGLYCDFFYYYSMSKWYGSKLILPMGHMGDTTRHTKGLQL